MKLSEFVDFSGTVYSLSSNNRNGVLGELVDSLVKQGKIPQRDRDSILESLIRREELGSTGIGRGVAVPHTKHDSVTKLAGVVGRSPQGVDFNALDGEPVFVFILLLSPKDEPVLHLKALEHISYVLKDERFCRFMKNTKTKKEMNDLIREADQW